MKYFLMFTHGHSGGSWFIYICNKHPARMSVLGEVYKPNQLNFAARGLTKKALTAETLKFFQDRGTYGDACVGVVKTFRQDLVDFVEAQGGKVVQAVRNPIHIVGKRMKLKPIQATQYFTREYGRAMETEVDVFEGHVLYYAKGMFGKFLSRAQQFPIIRLEDLNMSLGSNGAYFKRVMEAVTQTEWPDSYVHLVQQRTNPSQFYRFEVEWDKERRVMQIHSSIRTDLQRDGLDSTRTHWGDDVSLGYYWNSWADWQKKIYNKWFDKLDERLGYNGRFPTSVDGGWEWRGRYEWRSP